MSTYITRRRTNDGYNWFVVETKYVNGKLKRECVKCLGDTKEALEYFINSKDSELYEKFLKSLEKLKPEKYRYVIKSEYGYYGGRTPNKTKVKWFSKPKYAVKYTNESECVETLKFLADLNIKAETGIYNR